MYTVFLGLGSNVGDSELILSGALLEISKLTNTTIVKASSNYRTKPWGPIKNQNDFLNSVVKISTLLTPRELLNAISSIEMNFDRVRETPYGPRTLDIDILLFGDKIVKEEGLIIPQVKLEERIFVIEPLAEIEPELILPSGNNVKSVLSNLKNLVLEFN